MLEKECIKKAYHSAILSRIVYKINEEKRYNESNSFIENITDILSFNSNTFKKLQKNFPDDEFIEFIDCKETGLQSLIVKNNKEKQIYVIFRGTELELGSFDILANLLMFPKYLGEEMYVHYGYYRQLTKYNTHKKIIEKIKECLKENMDFKIVITGHSMGKILADTFTYYSIISEPQWVFNNMISNYGFAGPKAGNTNFYNYINNHVSSYNFMYKNDFANYLFPFYDCEIPIFVLSDFWYYYQDNKNDTSLKIYKEGFGNCYINDHSTKNYINSLGKICKLINKN